MTTTFQQLSFTVSSDESEHLSDLLTVVGADAVTMTDAGDEPIFEPPVGTTPTWSETVVTALFAEDINIDDIIKQLQQLLAPKPVPKVQISQLDDQDWERACLDQFKPIQFGNKLWICPSWHDTPDQHAVNVLLDPGLAFGTGSHPTTALCLEWLATHLTSDEIVIDYGCGSGILAIAAAKLGAAEVWATDIDPQALEATQANAQKNQVSIQTCMPDKLPNMQADVVIANILAKPLLELADTLNQLVKPAGCLVLSGLLAEQSHTIINTYQNYKSLLKQKSQEEWALLQFG